jgi:hypothetical protein
MGIEVQAEQCVLVFTNCVGISITNRNYFQMSGNQSDLLYPFIHRFRILAFFSYVQKSHKNENARQPGNIVTGNDIFILSAQ